jgi:hypothetical protein
MEERFRRALWKALNTPPKHRTAQTTKPKARIKGAGSQREDARLRRRAIVDQVIHNE